MALRLGGDPRFVHRGEGGRRAKSSGERRIKEARSRLDPRPCQGCSHPVLRHVGQTGYCDMVRCRCDSYVPQTGEGQGYVPLTGVTLDPK